MVWQAFHPAHSVRTKLFLLQVVILAPFVVLAIVWIRDSAMGERAQMISQLEGRADKVAAITSSIALEETAALKTIGEMPVVEQVKPSEEDSLLASLIPHNPPITEFYVLDASGMRIASTIQKAGKADYMGESDLFVEVTKSGQPFVGRAAISQEGRAAGQPVIPFAMPLRNDEGRLIGVLVANLDLSEIERMVTLGPDANGSYVYIVDRSGQVIAHPNADYESNLRDFSSIPIVQRFLKGQGGVEAFSDPMQKASMIGFVETVPNAGWGVVAVAPSGMISTTMAQKAFGDSVIFGVVFIFALVAAYYIGNGMASRITKLASVARAVGAGEVGRQVEPASRDEIGILASSLNALSGRLRDELESLQQVSQNLKRSCEDVGTALASGSNTQEAIRLAMLSAARFVGAEAAIGLVAEDEESLRVVKSLGLVPPQLIGQVWPLDDRSSILRRAIKQGRPQQLRDVLENEVPTDPVLMLGREAGFRSVLIAPLASYGRSLGALVLFEVRTPRVFSSYDVSKVQAIASEAAIAIDASRLQQEVKASNEQMLIAGLKLRAIIETIPEGVLVAEAPDGRITMANSIAERLLGREISAEVDLHEQPRVFGLYHVDGALFRSEELPLYKSVVLGVMDTNEIVMKRPEGKNLTLLFSSAPLRDADGKLAGGVAVFRDISEMKELDRLKDEFLSVTSHELKSPLTVIAGYAQLLQRRIRGEPGREEEMKWVEAITQQSSRLATLVERLLDVSRIQTGRLELVRSPMNLVALAREVAAHEQVTTTKHEIKVYAETPELIGNWDKARLEQVLINLIDNAIKYSPQGGSVDITIRRVADEALVAIEDHGIGISKEDQTRIFERFYRARIGKEEPAGLGLGLYVSYQIVTLHGGRMWVESELGKGSTFYFALPLSKKD